MAETIDGPRRAWPGDTAYHLRREVEERGASRSATGTSASRSHRDLANLHAQRAGRSLDTNGPGIVRMSEIRHADRGGDGDGAGSPAPTPLPDQPMIDPTPQRSDKGWPAMKGQDRLPLMNRPSIIRGATAGLAAGLVASFAMNQFQAAIASLSGSHDDAEPATEKAADGVARRVTGHELAAPERRLGAQLAHYGLGAGLGMLYGIAAEFRPGATMGRGAAFGLSVAAALDEAAVPAAGLGPPPWETKIGTHLYSLASHLVFGAACEFTRTNVRALLRPREA